MQQKQQQRPESILVMQGGGSLGAYECGVYNTLARHNIWFDVIAGASIGSVNATIVAASLRNRKLNKIDNRHDCLIESAKTLENFWLNSADNLTPAFLPFKIRSFLSAVNTFTFGHPNALIPIWFYPGGILLHNAFTSPYLYDTDRFRKVLEKTINFESLTKKEAENSDDVVADDASRNPSRHDNNNIVTHTLPRLILTCTDINKADLVIFDSHNMDITAEHVSACIAYPFYGLKWTKIDNRYLWDRSILSNTPLRAVVKSSPFREKRVIVSDTFPHHQERKLPNNFAEAWHRARDILFIDKSTHQLETSNMLKEIFPVLEEMHDIVTNAKIQDEKLKKRFNEVEKDYKSIINKRGSIISELIQIRRNEDEKSEHFLLEDWDFSLATIKELISQGEEDAERTLQDLKR